MVCSSSGRVVDVSHMQKGFTLLEVLVATFIFGVAVAASLAVLGASARSLSWVEEQQFAQLTAHNQLVMAALGQSPSAGTATNGGYSFSWRLVRSPTDTPVMSKIEVAVSLTGEEREVVRIHGYQGTHP